MAGGVAALAVVEVSFGVGFEVGAVGVAVAGSDFAVVVEILVEVGFAVPVQVVKPGNLIAPQDIDRVIHDLDAQRLKEAGGIAAPAEVLQLVVDAADDPDIAADRAEGGVAILEEVDAAESQEAFPGIVVWGGEGIDDKGAVGFWLDFAEDALGDDRVGKTGGAALGEGFDVFDGCDALGDEGVKRVAFRRGARPDRYFEAAVGFMCGG